MKQEVKTETKPRARERSRALDLSDAAPVKSLTAEAETELKNLVLETYKLNLVQNAAKSAYEKKRKTLLGLMKNKKLTKKAFEGLQLVDDGAQVTLEATVATPINEKADVEKLAKIVDPKTFLQIIKAGKGDIVKYVGEAVFEQVKYLENGEENVSVAIKKD